ncbi:MAG: pseudoazurin [Rhizobiaceae bacterium]|nr:pseudoazurin [Rhizobiaceae bacterium]
MKSGITRRTFSLMAATLPFIRPALAEAKTVEVRMYTKDPDNKKNRNVFLPRIVKISPGDTVKFVASERGHNSESTKGMLPEGTEGWKGKISKDIEVTFDKPGIYGYHCTPHRTLGMVGAVIVEGDGMTDNLEAAKAAKQRGKAKKVWQEIWAEIEEKNLLT